MSEYKISSNIVSSLNDISHKLWNGRASVMIGAGFSKNAKNLTEKHIQYPSWNELGTTFFQHIHNRPIDPLKDGCYINVLKLAEEFETEFSSLKLKELLETEIPDKSFEPSNLHYKLLELPWVDIFTTNYDTLLERASAKDNKYDLVTNQVALTQAKRPRIIKLHGTFPISEEPLIITEEHYRTYPQNYAPFINTVQQSLLENTLCLIGFSGDDPYFNSWVGWIRDNLGENAPYIYLIGVFNYITPTQEKLLNKRKIKLIDISCFRSKISEKNKENNLSAEQIVERDNVPSIDYKEVFLNFFNYLLSQKQEEKDLKENIHSIKWPSKEKYFHIKLNEEVHPQYKEIIEAWATDREEYPNWLIAPKDVRESLWSNTEYSFSYIYHLDKIEKPLDICFLYEFNWRIVKSLYPILNDWIEIYESVIAKYSAFFRHDNKQVIPETILEYVSLDQLKEYWLELQLSMLRYYREEGCIEKWEKLSIALQPYLEEFTQDKLDQYFYEQCLFYMFLLDIPKVRRELSSWNTRSSEPYWLARKASLLTELGEVDKAKKLLEKAYSNIKENSKTYSNKTDYKYVSQEIYLLFLIKEINYSIFLSSKIYSLKDLERDNDYYESRWNEIAYIKINPIEEHADFETYLSTDSPDNYKQKKSRYQFGIGRRTTTYSTGKNKYITRTYAYSRYREEIGLPYKYPGVSIEYKGLFKSITCLGACSQFWAFNSLIRSGNSQNIDDIWGRKTLALMECEEIDRYATLSINILQNSREEIIKGNSRDGALAILIAEIIPQILSRLCVKCSYQTRERMLDLLKSIYSFPDRNKYGKIHDNVKNLTYNLTSSFSKKELQNLLPTFFGFQIVEQDDSWDSFPDPIRLIPFDVFSFSESIQYHVKVEEVDTMITSLEDMDNLFRKPYFYRLLAMHKCDLLSENQLETFAENIWANVGKDGFPIKTGFYYFGFLGFPCPPNIDPKELLRKYILKSTLPIQSEKNSSAIGITDGRIDLFNNINGTASNKYKYQWNADDLNDLLKKVILWWNLDKHYLKDTRDHFMGDSTADEFKNRFTNMIHFFTNVVCPNQNLIVTDLYEKIKSLLNELKEFGMVDLQARSSFLKIFPDTKEGVYNDISKQLFSKDDKRILDAVNSISLLSKSIDNDTHNFLLLISQHIRSRSDIELHRFIEVMAIIGKSSPDKIEKEILWNIETGLEYLLEEVNITHEDSDETLHNKLIYKKAVAKLVIVLKKLSVNKGENIPSYIQKWESKLLDKNEFTEIRNVVLNGIENILN
ncbi:SIR2 family protein [Dysgonomonas sp. Marseille-P4361]|uniref:SIR2 family NAD-dependent protein deacylase n=1 Tax=Dysgonomonas sp. Marseille-P4361 TaxID=2161820 RepID=UPI000D54C8F6|nr:SIR2 family protein [Dysgonomonas sp. Marseille-P4361]